MCLRRQPSHLLPGALLLALLLPAAPAAAYILPLDFLLKKMSAKRTAMKFSRLTVQLRCRRATAEQEQPQTLYLKTPGLVRRERGGRLEFCRGERCLWVEDGKRQQAPAWTWWQYFFFVEPPSQARYLRLAKRLGIDGKRNTLSRLGGRVAVVLGAKNWERDRPQLWLDKDLFLPLRLFVRDGEGLVEILWQGWGSRQAGDWFPATLEVRRDGRLLEHCSVERVDSTRPLSQDLFRP